MNIYWFTLLFTAWYAFSLIISEYYGKRRRIGVDWLFFLSMLFSPVTGWVVSLLSGKKG